MKVKLEDIIEAMEFANMETEYYYDTHNEKVLMLFDEILDVDMDEMIYAYYGGMLGKATKHLPLVGHYTYNGEDSVSDMYFTWTLNSDSYPTELVVKDQWDEYRCTFTW